MRSNPNYAALDVNDRMGVNGLDNKLAYLAGAIRMCMNRNRDENGNGKIDEDELKWYLPASDQMEIISLCHYSLTDPLFNYNTFYGGDVNHQRLPDVEYLRGQYLYKYHYATSDYYTFASEELVNSSAYGNATQDYASHPYEMRCVRNLNSSPSDNSTPSDASVVKVFSYDSDTHTFTLDKLDSRSIRNVIYHMHELPSPHYLFSRDNLPYSKFKVASNNELLEKIITGTGANDTYPSIPGLTDAEKKILRNIIDKKPCANYYEESNKADQGTWRAPNAAEMGLMLMQLRASGAAGLNSGSYQDIQGDNGGPAFFWSNDKYYPFSSTSWNFMGPWGRVLGAKASNTNYWKFYLSDPVTSWGSNPKIEITSHWRNLPATDNYSDQSGASGKKIIIRCVKDLAN